MILDNFKTAKGVKINERKLISEIINFIKGDENFDYKILVGTDSEVNFSSSDFVSVIVVHRVGQGARYFWKRFKLPLMTNLRERLWKEALFSLQLSQELIDRLTKEDVRFYFEVHIDIGENGKSQSVVGEIINLIRGYGFEVKVKPESYAASKVADWLIS